MADRRNDIDRFGRWASTYDRSYLQRLVFEPVHRATLDTASRDVGQPGRVLDIGCGTGLLLRRVAAVFPAAELVGVDPAEEMVHQAQVSMPTGVSARFAHGAAEALPFADASFDLVVSSMSFHHWADQQTALREVRRVLAPGGLLALGDGFAVGWLRFAFWAAGKRHRIHTPAGVGRDARRAGPDHHQAQSAAANGRQCPSRGQPRRRRDASIADRLAQTADPSDWPLRSRRPR